MKNFWLLVCIVLLSSGSSFSAEKKAKASKVKKPKVTATQAAETPTSTPTPEASPAATPLVDIKPEPAPAPEPTPTETAAPIAEATIPQSEPIRLSDGYGKVSGLLGPVTLGPTVQLFTIPHPIMAGLEGKIKDYVGFGFLYQFFPKITISGVSAQIKSYDFRFRWFPFRGAFFLGAAYGQQTLKGSKSETLNLKIATVTIPVPVDASVEVKTTFITPHLGWRWTWESGFFMGMEFGWQIASKAETSLQAAIANGIVTTAQVENFDEYKKIKADVDDAGNKIGKQGLPHMTLLQFGFLF